jgi:Tol biopolymer transport system component
MQPGRIAATLGVVAALTFTSDALAAPAPNGDVAFECLNAQYYSDICVTDPETGTVTNLTDDPASDSWPTWSPDGTQIAFSSDYGIDVMNADGTDRRHVVGDFGTPAFEPAWSPDGSRLAYVSARNGGGYEIFTIAAGGDPSTITRLTTTAPIPNSFGKGLEDFQPNWSPDSARIVFVSTSRIVEDACDVWVMDATDADGDGNGDNLQQLTNDQSFNCSATEDINPAWSPAGDLIAYSSVASGDADVWVMNTDGSGKRNITQDPSWDWMPGWSPDGTQITFTSGRDGDDEIYAQPVGQPQAVVSARSFAARSAGAGARQLTFNDTPDRLSDWGAATSVVDALPESTITDPKQGQRFRRHSGTFHGTAADDRGVVRVEVRLMKRSASGEVRWWNGARFVPRSTAAPAWLPARGGTTWTYSVGRALPVASGARAEYTLHSRAVDDAGQVESQRVAGRNKVWFVLDRRGR